MHADLGFVVDADPTDRMLDPALGAGALLDMGIYPLTFAHLVLGEPARAARRRRTCRTAGIDLDVAIAGRYAGGALGHDDRVDDLLVARAPPRSPPTSAASTSRATSTTRRTSRWTSTPTPTAERRCAIEGAEPVIGRGYGNEIARGAPLPARRAAREPAGAARRRPSTLMRQMDEIRRPGRRPLRAADGRLRRACRTPSALGSSACHPAPPTSSSSPTGCPSTG